MEVNSGATWELSGTPPLPWSLQFTTDDGITAQVQQLVTRAGQTGLIDSGVQVPYDTLPPLLVPAPVQPPAAAAASPPEEEVVPAGGAGILNLPLAAPSAAASPTAVANGMMMNNTILRQQQQPASQAQLGEAGEVDLQDGRIVYRRP